MSLEALHTHRVQISFFEPEVAYDQRISWVIPLMERWPWAQPQTHMEAWAALGKGDYTGGYAVLKKVMREIEDDLVKPVRDSAGNIVRDAAEPRDKALHT